MLLKGQGTKTNCKWPYNDNPLYKSVSVIFINVPFQKLPNVCVSYEDDGHRASRKQQERLSADGGPEVDGYLKPLECEN